MANRPDILFTTLEWNCSDESIKNGEFTDYNWCQGNLDLWEASFLDVYKLVYMASQTYDARYLWSEIHVDDKIKGVIDAWNNHLGLSPVVFCRNGYNMFGIVSGNHRFSVTRAFFEKSGIDFEIPFLIGEKEHDWIKNVLPNAKCIKTINLK